MPLEVNVIDLSPVSKSLSLWAWPIDHCRLNGAVNDKGSDVTIELTSVHDCSRINVAASHAAMIQLRAPHTGRRVESVVAKVHNQHRMPHVHKAW